MPVATAGHLVALKLLAHRTRNTAATFASIGRERRPFGVGVHSTPRT